MQSPSIFTAELLPTRELAQYVRSYSFREFDTKGYDMIKPWHSAAEIALHFFFKALPVQLTSAGSNGIVKGEKYGVIGHGTVYNGEMKFNGSYSLFMVNFRPNGFKRLFQNPPEELNNRIIGAEDLFGNELKILYERLEGAANMMERVQLANDFLLMKARKQKPPADDRIERISNTILSACGCISVDQMADTANMSIRNLERCFVEEVGIPPKLFSSITRFNHALELKLRYPNRDWTSIAQDAGYFDQMHLVRAFKKYAGSAPSSFLKQTPLTGEIYSSRIE